MKNSSEDSGVLKKRIEELEAQNTSLSLLNNTLLAENEILKKAIHQGNDIALQLQKEKEFSETLIKSLPGVFYMFDEIGKYVRWNDNLERISAYNAAEISQLHPLDFFRNEDKEHIAQKIQEVFAEGSADVEANFADKYGNQTPYWFTGVLLKSKDKNYLIGVGIDISERKTIEQKLQETLEDSIALKESIALSEERYKKFAEASLDGILFHNAGVVIDSNHTLCTMFDYQIEELIGTLVTDYVRKDSIDIVKARLGLDDEKPFEAIGVKKDRTEFPIEIIGKEIIYKGKETRGVFIRNITERKKAEKEKNDLLKELQLLNEELKASEEDLISVLQDTLLLKENLEKNEIRLKKFFDINFEGIIFHEKGTILDFNPVFAKMFGYEIGEIIDTSAFRYIPEKHHAFILQNLSTGNENVFESEGLRKDGSIFPVVISVKNVEYLGKTVRAVAVRDISERKKIEAKLRESEKILQTVIDNSIQNFILLNEQAEIIYIDEKSRRGGSQYFNKTLTEGSRLKDFLDMYSEEQFYKNFQKALKGENVVIEREVDTLSGKKWLYIGYTPVFGEKKEVNKVLFSIVDVTQRKIAEEKILLINQELIYQNQQLNHYSEVISHNLRAPVASLMGLLNILDNEGNSLETNRTILNYIRDSVINLDTIIKDLNFILNETNTTNINENKSLVILEKELNNTKTLLKIQIEKSKANIISDFSEVSSVFCIKSFIQSIFQNLLTNAIKYKKPEEDPEIIIKAKKEEDFICISFSDNGLGFDTKKQKEHLFKLYKRFHTHVEGKGMGLHLVKTQVEMLGGKIEVESEINKGTTFKIYLKLK